MHEINFFTERDITVAFQGVLFLVCYRTLICTRSVVPTLACVVSMVVFSRAGWQAYLALPFALPAAGITLFFTLGRKHSLQSEGVLRFYLMFGEPALTFLLVPVYVEETKVLLGPLLLTLAWGLVHALFPPQSKDTATLFFAPILCCILLTAAPELLWMAVSVATGCQLIYVAISKSCSKCPEAS